MPESVLILPCGFHPLSHLTSLLLGFFFYVHYSQVCWDVHVIPALWRLRWEYPEFEAKLASEEEPLPKQNKPHVIDSSERLSTSRGIGGRQLKQILSDGFETGPLFVVNMCCEVCCVIRLHTSL